MELTEAKNVQKLKSNYHSVKGVGKTEPNPEENIILDCGTIVPLGLPIKKKEKTSLLYNEYPFVIETCSFNVIIIIFFFILIKIRLAIVSLITKTRYIVYDVAQVKVKYLFQIKFKYNY